MYDMRDIGDACRRYRKYIGYTQSEVAAELGFTGKAISGFECGRSYNAIILLWYVYHGIDLREVVNDGANKVYTRSKHKRFA